MLRTRLRTNAYQLARRMQNRPARVQTELERVARTWAREAGVRARRVMRAQIYAKPIPRSRTGREKWRRTRRLLNAEKWRPEGLSIIGENMTPYAAARHALGTPEGRSIVSEGVESVQWQDEVKDDLQEPLLAARRKAVVRGLRAAGSG